MPIHQVAVRLSEPSREPVTVTWETRNGTAIAGVDYESRSGRLTFNQGETVAHIEVNRLTDTPGVFYIDLTSATGASIGRRTGLFTVAKKNTTGNVQALLDSNWAFLQRATGANAPATGMPPLVTTEGLVKNNQFPGGALGGYTADGVASSEGISLLMRGVASAYKADKDPAKLAYLKFLMTAACNYFFFNARPTADPSPPWYHTWMVNAGEPFNVRGPLAPNGALDQGGYIGASVTFSDGFGMLNPAPDVVYQVATNGSQFVWNNVFSDIIAGTGERVNVEYYIDRQGNKVFGTQKGGSFGQPIQPNSGEPPGRIKLASSRSGPLLVNYATRVADTIIGYGEPYEAWPMWRKLAVGERAIAADAIHWFVDCFRIMRQAEPENPEWTHAHNRMLDVWREACNQESAGTYMFKAGANGPYNNHPLTYSYAFGQYGSGGTEWQEQPPTVRYTAQRTSDRYVTFTMPLSDGQNGRDIRYGVAFESQSLYLNYNATSEVWADVKVSAQTPIEYEFRSRAGQTYRCTVLHAPSEGVHKIPTRSFSRFTGQQWMADRPFFTFGVGVTAVSKNAALANGAQSIVKEFTLPPGPTGFGIDKAHVFPVAEWTVPPVVCYQSNTGFEYVVKDADGWFWSRFMLPSPQGFTTIESTWANFTRRDYQENEGFPPLTPASGPIQGVQFSPVANLVATTVIQIAYIGSSVPTYAGSGDIFQFTITYRQPEALVLKVGNVSLEGGSRKPIRYYGTLPFNYAIGGPSRNRLSATAYRGPYVAGYQSGTPWVDLGNDEMLSGMLDFMLEAQAQFQQRHPQRLLGPFMHCYLPAIWDSEQNGQVDTWVFDAPDGNPAWTGWQYRAFEAMAHTWMLCAEKGSPNAGKASTITMRFLEWLHGWMMANPSADYIPCDWGPPGWSQGQPFPANGYLNPHGTRVEPHDLALTLKAAIFAQRAGAPAAICYDVMTRCVRALAAAQVTDPVSPMRGSFTLNPTGFEVYGFHEGEILDALGIAVQNKHMLGES